MLRTLPDLLSTLTGFLPPWALALLLVALAAVALPGWSYSVRVKQIRGRLRRMGRAREASERERLADEAFALAAGSGRRLVALADEAIRLNHKLLWTRALHEIEALGTHAEDLRRLRAKVEPERPRFRHPVEAAVAVNRLLEEELAEQARVRLNEALAAFPHDEDLRALESTLPTTDEPARKPGREAGTVDGGGPTG